MPEFAPKAARKALPIFTRRSASYWPTFIRSLLPVIHEGPYEPAYVPV
jgi:hypothetical protein